MQRSMLAAISVWSLSLLLVCCSGDDKEPTSSDTGSSPEYDSGPARDTGLPGRPDGQSPPDTGTTPTPDTGTTPTPDTGTTPTPDTGVPPVPDDPMICKDCTANGNADCPPTGGNEYMCVSAWYQPAGGAKIEENYCARRCETLACPDNFSCETMTSPPAQICIPQPHNVCALLPP